MFCTKCGGAMADDAESCTACGTQVIRVRPTTPIGWNPPMSVPVPESSQEWEESAQAPVARAPVYAGFWLRAVAYAIDSFLLSLLATPLLVLVVPLAGNRWEQYSKLPTDEMFNLMTPAVLQLMAVVLPVVLLCGWLYYGLCESSSWQGTLGKRWLGLRVSDLGGQPVSFGRASVRFFSKIITGLVPLGGGYLLAGFTERKQALHDIIAGCLVLRRA